MSNKQKRKQHSREFKVEALKLAAKTRIPQAAQEVGLHASQVYSWRSTDQR